MAVMVQAVRVIRRKLIDRARAAGVCTGGVRGYEASKGPGRDGDIHGIVVPAAGGRVTGATLSHVHIWQPFTVNILRALPLSSVDEVESEQLDPELTDARDTIHSVLLAPIVYGDGVEIDPAGHAAGQPHTWDAGYLEWDGTYYRTATLSVGFVAFNALETTR